MTELRKSETPPVWLYWEGRKPPIVSLCIKTIRRYNPSARVLDYKAAAELGAAPVLKPFRRLPLCFQSNILRIWLTWKFGGIFIDADSICMSPIELVWMCYSYDFVGVTSPNWPARETVIGGRAGSPLLEQTFVRYQEVLRKFYDNKPNDRMLRPHIETGDGSSRVLFPHQRYYPLDYWDIFSTMNSMDCTRNPSSAVLWMINHHVYNHYRDWTETRILRCRNFLGKLFRHALGIE